MGFLNIPTSSGGFADDVVSLLANRRKIDQERELKRLQDEARQRIADEAQAAADEARTVRRDRKLADVGDTEENRKNLEMWGEAATVLDGKLYKDRGDAVKAWRGKRQEEVNRDTLAQHNRNYDAEVAALRAADLADQQEYDDAIKSLGEGGATPEALAALRAQHEQNVATAKRAYDSLQAKYLDKNGNLTGKKSEIARRSQELATAQGLLKEAQRVRQLMSGDRASVGVSEKQYTRGVSDATAKLLEAYLMGNPPPDLESQSGADRDLARSLEQRYPGILRVSQYAPEEAKAFAELLKQNSNQGDKATRFEEKTATGRETLYAQMLNAMRNLTAASARDSEGNQIKREAIQQRRDAASDRTRLGYAGLKSNERIADQNNLNRERISAQNNQTALQVGGLNIAPWVPEFEQYVNRLQRPLLTIASSTDAKHQASRQVASQYLYGTDVAPAQADRNATVTTKEGGNIIKKPTTVRRDESVDRDWLGEGRARLQAGEYGDNKKAKAAKASKGDKDNFGTPKPPTNPKFDFVIGTSGRWLAVPKKVSK